MWAMPSIFFSCTSSADPLLQRLLVDLVGQLVDHDVAGAGLFRVLEVGARAHHHLAAAGAVAFLDAIDAVDDAGGGKSRRRDDFHQFVDRCLGVAQQVQAGVHHLVEVVRRNVGRHAHGDAGRAIDEQVRQPRRAAPAAPSRAVVVGAEIDRLLVDVGQHLVRDLGQADFGVPHRRRVVAVDRAEVALAVHQHVAHREVLRHAHDGVVDRWFAVRVVLADDVTDDTGAISCRAGSSRCSARASQTARAGAPA